LQVHDPEEELLFLPEDKRQAALQVLIEGGGEDKKAKFQNDHPNFDPARELFDDKLKLLAQVLSASELEEYRLRHSPKVGWLREEVQYLNCTPEEFKALAELRERHLRPGNQDLSVDRATAMDEVRALFGNERAREYECVSDFGYLNVRRAADRAGIASDLGDRAGRIAYEARVAVERTAKDGALRSEERRRRIQELQSQAEMRLSAALGNTPQPALRSALVSTLQNTAATFRP